MKTGFRPWTDRVAVLLTAVPPLLIAYFIIQNNVDVIFWDEWDILWSFLSSYDAGTLTLDDLMTRHNEHIIFTTKITELLYLMMGATNRFYAYGVLFLTSLAFLIIVALQGNRTLRQFGLERTPWIWIAFSLLTFSVTGWENWAGGVQTQFLYVNVFSVASIVCLANDFSWTRLAGAFFLSVLALLSFSTGLSSLGIGMLILVLKPLDRRLKAQALAVWVLLSSLVLGTIHYFIPIPDLPYGDIFVFVRAPLAYIAYVTASLSTPLIYGHPSFGLASGGLGVFAFLMILLRIGHERGWRLRSFDPFLPWLAMAAYALFSLALVGVGRIDFGIGQAMSSRYSTLAAPFWISLIMSSYVVLRSIRTRRSHLIVNFSAGIIVLAMVAVVGYSSLRHYDHWKNRGINLRKAVAALKSEDIDAQEVKFLTPLPTSEIEKRLALFGKYGYRFAEGSGRSDNSNHAVPPQSTDPRDPDLSRYVIEDGWSLAKDEVSICELALSGCHPLLDRLSLLEEQVAKAAKLEESAKDGEIAQLKRKLGRVTKVLSHWVLHQRSSMRLNAASRSSSPRALQRIDTLNRTICLARGVMILDGHAEIAPGRRSEEVGNQGRTGRAR